MKHFEPSVSIIQSEAALSAVYAVVALLRGLTFESNWCISHTIETHTQEKAWSPSKKTWPGIQVPVVCVVWVMAGIDGVDVWNMARALLMTVEIALREVRRAKS